MASCPPSAMPPSSPQRSHSSLSQIPPPPSSSLAPMAFTLQSILSQHDNQPDLALVSLLADYNQLQQQQHHSPQLSSGPSSRPPLDSFAPRPPSDELLRSRNKLQDENRQLWALISKSKAELKELKAENRQLRMRLSQLESQPQTTSTITTTALLPPPNLTGTSPTDHHLHHSPVPSSDSPTPTALSSSSASSAVPQPPPLAPPPATSVTSTWVDPEHQQRPFPSSPLSLDRTRPSPHSRTTTFPAATPTDTALNLPDPLHRPLPPPAPAADLLRSRRPTNPSPPPLLPAVSLPPSLDRVIPQHPYHSSHDASQQTRHKQQPFHSTNSQQSHLIEPFFPPPVLPLFRNILTPATQSSSHSLDGSSTDIGSESRPVYPSAVIRTTPSQHHLTATSVPDPPLTSAPSPHAETLTSFDPQPAQSPQRPINTRAGSAQSGHSHIPHSHLSSDQQIRRKASSVDMAKPSASTESSQLNQSTSAPFVPSVGQDLTEEPAPSMTTPTTLSSNSKLRLSLYPSNHTPASRSSNRFSVVPPEVKQYMLSGYPSAPSTPLLTSPRPAVPTLESMPTTGDHFAQRPLDLAPSPPADQLDSVVKQSPFAQTPLVPSKKLTNDSLQASVLNHSPLPPSDRKRRPTLSPSSSHCQGFGLPNPASTSPIDPAYSTQPTTKRRMLTPTFLPFTHIKVTNSHIRANDKSKEVISFSININVVIPPESDPERKGAKASWMVEKLYSDVLALDHLVKSKHSKSQNKALAQLPDRALFKDHAPSKVDARKAVLQKYLQSLCAVQLKEKTDVCDFFNSNIVINERTLNPSRPGYMQGYLTKKGRNFGGWQTRFYVLEGPILEYFDARGGNRLGHIAITGAQIGRQQQRNQEAHDDSYRHAFLIRMHKREKEGDIDHILCAETDEERDAWVEALTCYVTGRYVSADPAAGSTSEHSRPPPHPAAHEIRSRRQTSVDSSTRSDSTHPLASSTSNYDQRSDHYHKAKQGWNQGHHKTDSLSASLPASYSEGHGSRNASSTTPASTTTIPEESSIAVGPSSDDQQAAHQDNLGSKSDTRDPPNRTTLSFGEARDSHNRPAAIDPRTSMSNSLSTGPTTPRPHVQQSRQFTQHIHGSPQQEPTNSDAESIITSLNDRPSTPDSHQRPKISGPMNGAPITGGYRIKPLEEKKAKFRSAFWGFTGRNNAAIGDRKDTRDTNSGSVSSSSSAAFAPAPRPVFGVSLQEAVSVARVHEGLDLPAVVFRCVEFLEAKGAIEEEGIYRLSGSSVNIKAYKERFNTEGDFNLLESSKTEYHDVHAVAGLLKQFLRELASPILTRELHPEFLKVIDLSQRSDKVNELGRLCAELPLPNYTLLRFLSAHLIHIVQNEKVNKMSMRNVGIVFSPTLGMPAPLFALLLKEFDLIFNIEGDSRAPIRLPGEIDESLTTAVLPVNTASSKRVSRNSMLYSATGADTLMEHTKLERTKTSINEDSDSDVDYDSSSEPDEEIIASSKRAQLEQRQAAMSQLMGATAEPNSNLSSQTPSPQYRSKADAGQRYSLAVGFKASDNARTRHPASQTPLRSPQSEMPKSPLRPTNMMVSSPRPGTAAG